ncbi:hypothetical protein [Tunturiibacter gelidiferens]|uniref:hypothetical protein n=1 Tax=Tunturiibacter gelidiferens TaxID=3069689 RepID=UPI003D9B8F15
MRRHCHAGLGRKDTTHPRRTGGVGTKPWRSIEAEKALEGQSPDRSTFVKAAEAALRDAKPASENAFKVELTRRCIVRALAMSTKSA